MQTASSRSKIAGFTLSGRERERKEKSPVRHKVEATVEV